MKRSAVAILLVSVLAGACAESAIPQATAADLQSRVADIRSVVEDGRIFAARQQLEKLAGIVDRLMDRQKLDSDTALEILAAIGDVRAALPSAPEPSPVTEPTAEPTTPPPPPPEEEDEGGNGQGNDKDKGGGHGDEGHGNDD
jgi:outer membrane biosynthesis protein TonB